jgi:DNA (cytosine-5)-methyltransferase 1
MTCGLKQAGIEVIAGIDIDPTCKETYEANNAPAKFVLADVKEMPVEYLERELGVRRHDDSMIFIGCSPCQYWSVINTLKAAKKDKAALTSNLLTDFQRFVDYYEPGFILIENVPGMKTRKDSPFAGFLAFLLKKGYLSPDFRIINANYFGVPQNRRRFVLLASRVWDVRIPSPDEPRDCPDLFDAIGDPFVFPPVPAGHRDETDFMHTAAGLQDKNAERLKLTEKNGGRRYAWKDRKDLQLKVYEGKDDIFKDSYGRMSWEKPASTITTKFFGVSHGCFAHPEQNRAISLREGARIQTFPLNYCFKTKSIEKTARLIGNAVPPELARRLGEALKNSIR